MRLLAAAVALLATVAQGAGGTIDLRDFTLTFNEDFRSLDVSAHGPGTRWIAHTPWNGDFGDAVFDDPGPSGPFTLSSGGLSITARQEDKTRWHSGLLCTRDRDGAAGRGFAQQYGYFEIRTKLPPGPGTWPAFWLIGTDKSSSSSEIDVFEYYGKFPDGYHAVTHVWTDRGDRYQNRIIAVPSGSLTDHFNDFGVMIEPEKTRFYLNRQEVWTVDTPTEYRQPFYLLVDLALGSGWPTAGLPSPSTMTVEYVRVWKKNDISKSVLSVEKQ